MNTQRTCPACSSANIHHEKTTSLLVCLDCGASLGTFQTEVDSGILGFSYRGKKIANLSKKLELITQHLEKLGRLRRYLAFYAIRTGHLYYVLDSILPKISHKIHNSFSETWEEYCSEDEYSELVQSLWNTWKSEIDTVYEINQSLYDRTIKKIFIIFNMIQNKISAIPFKASVSIPVDGWCANLIHCHRVFLDKQKTERFEMNTRIEQLTQSELSQLEHIQSTLQTLSQTLSEKIDISNIFSDYPSLAGDISTQLTSSTNQHLSELSDFSAYSEEDDFSDHPYHQNEVSIRSRDDVSPGSSRSTHSRSPAIFDSDFADSEAESESNAASVKLASQSPTLFDSDFVLSGDDDDDITVPETNPKPKPDEKVKSRHQFTSSLTPDLQDSDFSISASDRDFDIPTEEIPIESTPRSQLNNKSSHTQTQIHKKPHSATFNTVQDVSPLSHIPLDTLEELEREILEDSALPDINTFDYLEKGTVLQNILNPDEDDISNPDLQSSGSSKNPITLSELTTLPNYPILFQYATHRFEFRFNRHINELNSLHNQYQEYFKNSKHSPQNKTKIDTNLNTPFLILYGFLHLAAVLFQIPVTFSDWIHNTYSGKLGLFRALSEIDQSISLYEIFTATFTAPLNNNRLESAFLNVLFDFIWLTNKDHSSSPLTRFPLSKQSLFNSPLIISSSIKKCKFQFFTPPPPPTTTRIETETTTMGLPPLETLIIDTALSLYSSISRQFQLFSFHYAPINNDLPSILSLSWNFDESSKILFSPDPIRIVPALFRDVEIGCLVIISFLLVAASLPLDILMSWEYVPSSPSIHFSPETQIIFLSLGLTSGKTISRSSHFGRPEPNPRLNFVTSGGIRKTQNTKRVNPKFIFNAGPYPYYLSKTSRYHVLEERLEALVETISKIFAINPKQILFGLSHLEKLLNIGIPKESDKGKINEGLKGKVPVSIRSKRKRK